MFDKNYSQLYDLFNLDKPYQKEVEFVYDWAGDPKSILDIGCGTGNYWGYFPKGVTILGVDRSKPMILSNTSGLAINADITRFKFKDDVKFDCATALFDVINYIPKHGWWKNLPIRKGGTFIFDTWSKSKVLSDGFKTTVKEVGSTFRRITPLKSDDKSVDLLIEVGIGQKLTSEIHTLYLHGHEDIQRFCGKEFDLEEVRDTGSWQRWYRLRKK